MDSSQSQLGKFPLFKRPIHPVYSTLFLLLTYLSGAIGLSIPNFRPFFLQLVPFNLLLSFSILIAYHSTKINLRFIFISSIIVLLTFLAEIIGVNTGEIFGLYSYGNSLGIKLWNTPPIIGINWFILIYTSSVTVRFIHMIWLRSIVVALIMLLFDIIMEPVAIRLDFWTWQQNQIPLQNYVAWFMISFVMSLLFNYSLPRFSNPTASVLLCLQTLFFLVLRITL